MISSAARPEPPGGSRQYFSAEFHRYQTAALSLCLGICWNVLVNYYPNFATVDDLLLSSYYLDDFAQILSRGRVACPEIFICELRLTRYMHVGIYHGPISTKPGRRLPRPGYLSIYLSAAAVIRQTGHAVTSSFVRSFSSSSSNFQCTTDLIVVVVVVRSSYTLQEIQDVVRSFPQG